MSGHTALCLFGLAAVAVSLIAYANRSEADSKALAVTRVVRLSLLTNTPRVCTTYETVALLEQVEGEVGAQAVRKCLHEAGQDDSGAKDLRFYDLSISGDRAVVTAEMIGGFYAGSRFTLEVLRTATGWKVDHVLDLKLNRDGFDRAMRAAVIRDGAGRDFADCYVRTLRQQVSTHELELAVMQGRGQEVGRSEALGCARGHQLKQVILWGLRRGIARQHWPASVNRCIMRRVRGLDQSFFRGFLDPESRDRRTEILGRIILYCNPNLPNNPGTPWSPV